jgi:signal transduction histidine kinase
MPEDYKKNIFKPFVRGSNAAVIEGTGLGLSIVWNSVQMHSGNIEVESQINEGTKFIVYLPKK